MPKLSIKPGFESSWEMDRTLVNKMESLKRNIMHGKKRLLSRIVRYLIGLSFLVINSTGRLVHCARIVKVTIYKVVNCII